MPPRAASWLVTRADGPAERDACEGLIWISTRWCSELALPATATNCAPTCWAAAPERSASSLPVVSLDEPPHAVASSPVPAAAVSKRATRPCPALGCCGLFWFDRLWLDLRCFLLFILNPFLSSSHACASRDTCCHCYRATPAPATRPPAPLLEAVIRHLGACQGGTKAC